MKHINLGHIFFKTAKAYLIALCVFVASEAVFYQYVVDPSDYVQYSAVEPSKKVYWIGEEDLFFRSFANIKKDVNLYWEDIIFCDIKGDEYEGGFFSRYISGKTSSKPSKWEGKGVWRYGAEIPIQEAKCHLRSTTFAVFPVFFGLEIKRPLEVIRSNNEFEFRKKKD